MDELIGYINTDEEIIGYIYPGQVEEGVYDGGYELTSKAHEEQTIRTQGKLMTQDITVLRIPYYEAENLSGGKTVYIANQN